MTLPAANDIAVRLIAAEWEARPRILGEAMDADPAHIGSTLIDVISELLAVVDGLLENHPDGEKLAFIFHAQAELIDIKADIETG